MAQAGKFRELVKLYSPGARMPDGIGGFLPAGSETYRLAWAQVRALRAKEELENGKVVYRQPFTILLRYDAELGHTTRIEFGGRRLSVTSVIIDEKAAEIALYAIADR